MAQIHIGRGTTNLGAFEVEEIQAGLITGRFLPSDLGWKEGMANWKPLSEFEEFAPRAASQEPGQPPMPEFPGAIPGGISPSGQPGEVAPGEGLPWDRREELGAVQAYIETVKLVLTEPGRAFTQMRQEGGLLEPLLFALIGGVIGNLAALVYKHAFSNPAAVMAQIQQLPPQLRPLFTWMLTGQSLGAEIILVPFTLVLLMFITAAIFHVCLMLVGGANRSFETTFRVICYSIGATSLLNVLPYCGGVIAGVWNLICYVIGLAKAHDTQTGRALTAVLLPVICCCSFLVALVIAILAIAHR
jgi:hypothetical protein